MGYEEKQKSIEKEMRELSNNLSNLTRSKEYSQAYKKEYSDCENKFTYISKDIEEAAKEFAEQGEWQCPTSFEEGAKFMQNKYEANNNWFLVEKQLPEKQMLVIADSGENTTYGIAIAYYECGIWKYSNGQKLWFNPTQWRSFL